MTPSEGRGLLTETERAYLQGDREVPNPRKVRQQIRQRTRALLSDLQLLYHEMEDRDIEQAIQGQDSSEEIENQFVDSLAFLYRTAQTGGIEFEPLAWEAFYKGYADLNPSHAPNISIQIDGESRDAVIKRAEYKKSRNRTLSDVEVRAIVETGDFDSVDETAVKDYLRRQSLSSEPRVREYIKQYPEVIEPGFEIIDFEPSEGGSARPDLVGQDSEGQTVLIEIRTDTTQHSITRGIDHLESLIDDFGGEDRVRGILITPSHVDYAEYITEASPVEYQSISENN